MVAEAAILDLTRAFAGDPILAADTVAHVRERRGTRTVRHEPVPASVRSSFRKGETRTNARDRGLCQPPEKRAVVPAICYAGTRGDGVFRLMCGSGRCATS